MEHLLSISDKIDISTGPDLSDSIVLSDRWVHNNSLSRFANYRRTWGVNPEVIKFITALSYLWNVEPDDLYTAIIVDQSSTSYKDTLGIVDKFTDFGTLPSLSPSSGQSLTSPVQLAKWNPSPASLVKLMKFLDDLAICHGWTRPAFLQVENDLSLTPYIIGDPIDNRHLNIKNWLTQIIDYIKTNIKDYELFFTGMYDLYYTGLPDRSKDLRGLPARFVTSYEKGAKFKQTQFSHPFPVKLTPVQLGGLVIYEEKKTNYPFAPWIRTIVDTRNKAVNFDASFGYGRSRKKTRLFISYVTDADLDNYFAIAGINGNALYSFTNITNRQYFKLIFSPVPVIVYGMKIIPGTNPVQYQTFYSDPVLNIDQSDTIDHSNDIKNFYNSQSFCIDNNFICEDVLLREVYINNYFVPNFSINTPLSLQTYVYEVTFADANFRGSVGNLAPPGDFAIFVLGDTNGPGIAGSTYGRLGGGFSFYPVPSEIPEQYIDAYTLFLNACNDQNDPRTTTVYDTRETDNLSSITKLGNFQSANNYCQHLTGYGPGTTDFSGNFYQLASFCAGVPYANGPRVGGPNYTGYPGGYEPISISYQSFGGYYAANDGYTYKQVKNFTRYERSVYLIVPLKDDSLRSYYGINFLDKLKVKFYFNQNTNSHDGNAVGVVQNPSILYKPLLLSYAFIDIDINIKGGQIILYKNAGNYKELTEYIKNCGTFTEIGRLDIPRASIKYNYNTFNGSQTEKQEVEATLNTGNLQNAIHKYCVFKVNFEYFNSGDDPRQFGGVYKNQAIGSYLWDSTNYEPTYFLRELYIAASEPQSLNDSYGYKNLQILNCYLKVNNRIHSLAAVGVNAIR